jgi:hypothetical protein
MRNTILVLLAMAGVAWSACDSSWGFNFSVSGTTRPCGTYYEYGTKFQPICNMRATGARVYATSTEKGNHNVRLWRKSDGVNLSGTQNLYFPTGSSEWKNFTFSSPIQVDSGVQYIISISTDIDSGKCITYMTRADTIDTVNSMIIWPGAMLYTATAGNIPNTVNSGYSFLRDIYLEPLPIAITATIPSLRNIRAGDSIIINGTAFDAPCSVFIGGIYCASNRINSTQIRMKWPTIRSLRLKVKAAQYYTTIDSTKSMVWNSSSSDSWKTAANWTPEIIPSYYDTARFNATSVVNCKVDTSYNIKALIIDSTFTGYFNDGGQQCTVGVVDSINTNRYLKYSGMHVYPDSAVRVYLKTDSSNYVDSTGSSVFSFSNNASFTNKKAVSISKLILSSSKSFDYYGTNGQPLTIKSTSTPLMLNNAKITMKTSSQIIVWLTANDTFVNSDISDTVRCASGVSASMLFTMNGDGTIGYIRPMTIELNGGLSLHYGSKNTSIGSSGSHTFRFIGAFNCFGTATGGGDLSISSPYTGRKTKVYFDGPMNMIHSTYPADGTIQWGCPAPTCSLEINFGVSTHELAYFSQLFGGGGIYDSGYQKINFGNSRLNMKGDWTYTATAGTGAEIVIDSGASSIWFNEKIGSSVQYDSIRTYGVRMPSIVGNLPATKSLIISDSLLCSSIDIKSGKFKQQGKRLRTTGNFYVETQDSVSLNSDSLFIGGCLIRPNSTIDNIYFDKAYTGCQRAQQSGGGRQSAYRNDAYKQYGYRNNPYSKNAYR